MLRKLSHFKRAVTGLVLGVVVAAPTFAQFGGNNTVADIKAPPVTVQINPSTVRINKRTAIPFKPFEMLDPQSGKPVSRETKLPALPNGTALTAGEYYDQINALEQKFSALGYTLREKGGAPIQLQESIVPEATLKQQADKMRAEPVVSASAIASEQKMALMTPQQIETLNAKAKILFPTPKTVKYNWNWGYGVGSASTFAANISAKLDLIGTSGIFGTTANAIAEAKAGGSVFGSAFELVRVTGNLKATHTFTTPDTMTAKLGVYVLGSNVYNLDKTTNAQFQKNDSLSKTVDKSVNYYFSLGPIPMKLKAGVQGKAGIGYGITVAPIAASASIGPFVNTKGYIQVGVDIAVAGAGVGGSLTFLNSSTALSGEIAFGIDALNKPFFFTKAKLCYQLEMLSGKLYVYAYVYVPCFDWPPWCKKQWDWTIWNWSGFEKTGCFFNHTKVNYLT